MLVRSTPVNLRTAFSGRLGKMLNQGCFAHASVAGNYDCSTASVEHGIESFGKRAELQASAYKY